MVRVRMRYVLRAAEPVLRVAVPFAVYAGFVPAVLIGLAAHGAYISLRRHISERYRPS